ncbi:diadenylate cyclase [Pseudomonas citrulli]|uniref:Diadenylate cyclase n=1 Tax=Pseudomonas citrulli TaxID=3064347 RepID=A0ABT9BUV9_9PSED|nr:diadenylate cyclase [Pseudomonas sp. K18]MDO7896346.1 diadenylate cyclase [Pseudomonas sp. K18]
MSDEVMLERLVDLLRDITALSGQEFSGLGVIVLEDGINLPVFPMRVDLEVNGMTDSVRCLAEISNPNNDLHDGFHILNSDLRIVSLTQYFSPPIPPGILPNRSRAFGGRYLAALFGSLLPGVIFTGISTPRLGIVVFKDGSEVYFQEV